MERILRNSGNERELHIIFGTGPAGLTLADDLLASGKRARLVHRSGKAPVPAGVELVAADAMDATAAVELCRGRRWSTTAPTFRMPSSMRPCRGCRRA
jgi:hypothetical protein